MRPRRYRLEERGKAAGAMMGRVALRHGLARRAAESVANLWIPQCCDGVLPPGAVSGQKSVDAVIDDRGIDPYGETRGGIPRPMSRSVSIAPLAPAPGLAGSGLRGRLRFQQL